MWRYLCLSTSKCGTIPLKPASLPDKLGQFVPILRTLSGLPGGCRFFGGGGESGIFRGEHSVEDHYLHINGIIFWGGVGNFGGILPPKQASRKP